MYVTMTVLWTRCVRQAVQYLTTCCRWSCPTGRCTSYAAASAHFITDTTVIVKLFFETTRVGLIYIIDIYPRYIRYFRVYWVLQFFNVTHCDYVLIFSLCVLLAYDVCSQHFLSIGQLLSDFTSPQSHSLHSKYHHFRISFSTNVHVCCHSDQAISVDKK